MEVHLNQAIFVTKVVPQKLATVFVFHKTSASHTNHLVLIDGECFATFLMKGMAQEDGSKSRCTELATLAPVGCYVVITKASKDFEMIDGGCYSKAVFVRITEWKSTPCQPLQSLRMLMLLQRNIKHRGRASSVT